MKHIKLIRRIRKNILTIFLFIILLEFTLFSIIFSLQKSLYAQKAELTNIQSTLIKNHKNTGNGNGFNFVIANNTSECIAYLKNMATMLELGKHNIYATTFAGASQYKISGQTDFAKFVDFLTKLRKSQYILRVNKYKIKFNNNNNVEYAIEIQTFNTVKQNDTQ